MARESVSSQPASASDRVPPYSEEAEKGVLGSILLDSHRVLDLCLEAQVVVDAFYIPAHRSIFEAMVDLSKLGQAVDVLTVTERLRTVARLDEIGGAVYLDRLIDSTPTAAHAEYYADIVRQKHLLRCVISAARDAENDCYTSEDGADLVLSRAEQSFFDITERQHGFMLPWDEAVKGTMQQIEKMLLTRRGLTGLSTGFVNLDHVMQGLKASEMIVLAARPSMGKTSLAMNIVENVALGKNDPEHKKRPVGIFSLEMSHDSLVMRMLCSHAGVRGSKISSGYASHEEHGKLATAASVLSKAPIFLDDTGGLDILELRARARRMKKKYGVELIVIDYLQLLHSKSYTMQGKQIETADISGNLKSMAKELKLPVMVLSQLSRAPDQRGDRAGKPRLSDLRDSGAIEQDADVVCMLRRPCKYPDDPDAADETLAVVDIAKHRNGPTGETKLNFEDEYTRFTDRTHGVDDGANFDQAGEPNEVRNA
ncbi:MAG: replicative DNA helicase [Verrucomicrobia bacterium]|nr:replicative DNA helicase [Verrucomicrobiota bacterium]